jgi:hypothetical protein
MVPSLGVDSLFARCSWLAITGGQCITFAMYLAMQRRANDPRLFRYERRDLLSSLFQMKRAFSIFPGCPTANFFRAPLFAARPLQVFHQLYSLSTNGELLIVFRNQSKFKHISFSFSEWFCFAFIFDQVGSS